MLFIDIFKEQRRGFTIHSILLVYPSDQDEKKAF